MDFGQTINRLAVIEIPINPNQNCRLDLPKPVEHPLHAKIRRGRRPNRPQAGRREHGDDRFRHIRHIAGHSVALPYSGAPPDKQDERNEEHDGA